MYPCTVPWYLQWETDRWQRYEGKNEPALHWTQPMRLDWAGLGLRVFAWGPCALQFSVLSIDCPSLIEEGRWAGGQQTPALGEAFLGSSSTSSKPLSSVPFPLPRILSHHLHLAQYSSASVEQSRASGDCISSHVQISLESTRH